MNTRAPFERRPQDASNERLLELVGMVIDPNTVLGPLDIEDLHHALVELVARRNQEALELEPQPEVRAA